MNPIDVDVSAEVARALLERWTDERTQAREQAIDAARKLVSAKLGKLERADFEQLFKYFHADFHGGRATGDRFSQAFTGSLSNKLLEHITELNQWTERLWQARNDDEVAEVLDALWAVSKRELPGAGRSFPTVLLYARGPERYWPLIPAIEAGYRRLTGAKAIRRSGKAYIDYVRWVREWRAKQEIPEHAVDLVLSMLGTEASAEASPDAPAVAPEIVSKPIELELELRLLEPWRCNVRLPGAEWPPGGASLPSAKESLEIADQRNPADIERLGQRLFRALFDDEDLKQRYESARTTARDAGVPLRLVLSMHADADDEQRCTIARYAWETIVDRDHGPLAINPNVRLVRKRVKPGPPKSPLQAPAPVCPVRVDVGFASPEGEDYELLDLFHEWRRLAAIAERSKTIDLKVHARLDRATLEGFISKAHVFHYAGHGERGELILEGPNRQPELIAGEALRTMIPHQVPPAVPRLVVLNACYGSADVQGWISVAQAFADLDVPVVVAMSGKVSDRTAQKFCEELHDRLAVGWDVERAVQRARWRAFAERGDSWFMPVLWTRTSGSFELVEPDAARTDPVVEAERVRLEKETVHLERRVEVLQQLSVRHVEAEHRHELADTLLDDNDLDEPIERVLDDNTIDRVLAQIRRRNSDPSVALREVATSQRELVSQLSAALQAVVARPEPSAQPKPLLEAPIDDSQPLRLPPPKTNLDEVVDEILERSGLVLDDAIVRRCVIHLLAGRHLVLAGPPGTGKSTLAQALARAFGYASMMATANPDWTTFDTIGGLAPDTLHDSHGRAHLSYPFQPGWVLRAVEANWAPTAKRTWLVIDEMNRAPLDQAFGDLFTALVDHRLRDPRRADLLPIPKDFRLICTTNTADRRLLFEFSEALKRRFAFVEIPAFANGKRGLLDGDVSKNKLLAQLHKRPALDGVALTKLDDTIIEQLGKVVERVRVLFPLGLAQVLDVLTYVAVGLKYDGDGDELLKAALLDNFLPLLEAQSVAVLEAIADLLDGSIDAWIDRFLAQANYQPEPGSARVASELLAQLAGHEVNRRVDVDWVTEFEQDNRKDKIIAAARPALSCAADLTKALRRVVAERHD